MTRVTNARVRVAGAVAVWLALLAAAPDVAAEGVIVITQAKALAGNVTPGDPAGFPVVLTTTGSYRLDSDLQVPAGRNGIVVLAPNITIDLNGFQISGGTVALRGIAEGASKPSGITIRNGTISGFTSDGIRSSGGYWTVEGMRIVLNRGNGITAGFLLQVRDSTIYRSGLRGVVSGNQATILGSAVVASGGDGIFCANHCLIANNMISQNGQSGAGVGVSADLGTVLGNTISGNRGLGIRGSFTGYGNNTLVLNNGAGPQVSIGLFPLQPNACSPAC